MCSNLVVEKHVDDWIDNSAKLCQDWGNHTGDGSDQAWASKSGH